MHPDEIFWHQKPGTGNSVPNLPPETLALTMDRLPQAAKDRINIARENGGVYQWAPSYEPKHGTNVDATSVDRDNPDQPSLKDNHAKPKVTTSKVISNLEKASEKAKSKVTKAENSHFQAWANVQAMENALKSMRDGTKIKAKKKASVEKARQILAQKKSDVATAKDALEAVSLKLKEASKES